MYIHYIQFNGRRENYRLYVGPFDDEASAEAFRQRMERTRQQSPHLTMEGCALEISPGIDGRYSAISPDQFLGFQWTDLETEETVIVPLVE